MDLQLRDRGRPALDLGICERCHQPRRAAKRRSGSRTGADRRRRQGDGERRSRLGFLEPGRNGHLCRDRRQRRWVVGISPFSEKSTKYSAATTTEKWHLLDTSPPERIGAGTLFHLAFESDPSWRDAYDETILARINAAGRDPVVHDMIMAEIAASEGCGGPIFEEASSNSQNQKTKKDAKTEAVLSAILGRLGGDSYKSGDGKKKNDEKTSKQKLLLTSAEFVAGFVPPDYLIDGLLQRRYVYSFTGPTGSGKTAIMLRVAAHVAMGLALGGREVDIGRVLFFAGENPDDVRTRWIKLCEEMKLDHDTVGVVFMPFTPNISEADVRQRIDAEATVHGPFSLLIVDTSAAYYSGNDENDNVALGNHARMLRTFINLPGGPTVMVTCHPIKNADMNNLVPRGGGAFLAEVDGNLVCIKKAGSTLAEITTHGKFRGPEFDSFFFKLMSGTSERLKDSKDRSIWTVFAVPIGETERSAMEEASDAKTLHLLRRIKSHPASSFTELATALGWTYQNGEPNRSLVQRLMNQLLITKLVEKKGQRYVITKKGIQTLEDGGIGGGSGDGGGLDDEFL
jgi:hypothetical protein